MTAAYHVSHWPGWVCAYTREEGALAVALAPPGVPRPVGVPVIFLRVSHWVFSILKYITKVKLLFLYIFYVLYVLFHYKPLSGDGGRVRPHFYVLR